MTRQCPTLAWFRKHLRLPVSALLLATFSLWSVQVKGATLTWDGGANTWDNGTTSWWNGGGNWTSSFNNTALFGGTAGVVTLNDPISAGGLIFNSDGYSLTGNTLTLGVSTGFVSPAIAVNNTGSGANRATISSVLAGTSGFTKTGDGTLVLTNSANTYTGDTVINSGSVVITNQGQLGLSTGTISINGIAQTGNPGFSGGQLVVQGGLAGTTISREISVLGRGPGATNSSGGLVSVGNNTFSGDILIGGPASEGRIVSGGGTVTLSGLLTIGTGASNVLYGNGNFNITGQVTGFDLNNDRFVKTNNTITTTLTLANSSNNFLESIRIDSGTVRVATVGALGLNNSTQAIDLNNGTLELRTDTNNFTSKKIFARDNATATIFVDHAVGTSAINQTIAFGDLRTASVNSPTNFNSRNGFGATFTGAGGTIGTGGANSTSLTVNANGLITFNANLWNQGDGTARTLTLTGSGDVLVTGNILRTGGGAHVVTKSGTGTWTLAGTAGTYIGGTNVTGNGTLAINSIGALNGVAGGSLNLNSGVLSYLGAAVTGAGETTAKVVNLSGTTGAGILLANQAGTSPTPLVFTSNIAAGGLGAKTLFLGGTNALENEIQGAIFNSTFTGATFGGAATSVTKVGSGTWVLGPNVTNPAGSATAATTAAGAVQTNILTVASTASLALGQPVSGANVPANSVITAITSGTTFTISNPIGTTAVASGATLTFGPITGSTASANTTAVTTASTTVTVASTANLVPGQLVTGAGVAANTFIATIASATTFTTNTTNTIASATPLSFGSSPNFSGNLTVAGGTLKARATSETYNIFNDVSTALIFNADTLTGNQSAGGTFEYLAFGSGAGSAEALGSLTATAGAGTIKITSGVGSTNSLSFLNLGTRGAGATLSFAPDASGSVQFVTAPAGLNGIMGGFASITDPVTGAIDFVATPVANTNIAALGAATALPNVTGSATTNYVLTGAYAGTGVVAANSLRIVGAGQTVALGGNLTITATSATALGGVLFDNSNGAATISGFSITTSGTNQELVFTVGGTTAANALTVNSNLINGTGGVTKSGNGTLVLGGTNTYTGTTTINGGTIQLAGTGTLGGTNASLMIRQNGTLDLNGVNVGTVASGGLNAFNGAGTITNNAASGAAVLRVGNNNSAGLFSGVIQDGVNGATISFSKGGTGTVSLTGLNTFTGPVTIGAGVLSVTSLADIGVASDIGKGDATSDATNAASLVFAGAATGALQYTGANASVYQTTQTPSVSINRLFTLAGNGIIDSSGTYGTGFVNGGTNQNNAALILNNTGAVAFSGATGGRTLTLQGSSTGDNEIRIHLVDNDTPTTGFNVLGFTKAGTGLWILNPSTANTYTGTTLVSGGMLQAVDGVGLSSGSNLTLNGGVFQTSGTFTRNLGTGAGQVQLSGGASGFAASTAPLTVTLDGGSQLTWGSATFSPTALTFNTPNGGQGTALFGTTLTNDINLGAAARTVLVEQNGNTSTAQTQATLSGVISGIAGGTLSKTGSGVLLLGDANTYVGNTLHTNGSLVVTSIGASGATATSLGTNVSGGSLLLGTGGNTTNLLYVGPGETVTRPIVFPAAQTTGTIQIDSSGSGPLTLTSITNSAAGAFILALRGTNTDANMVTSQLTNGGANVLSIQKNDGGVWILNPSVANTFTGSINVNQGSGLLGLTANGIGTAANITLTNGGLFAFGGDLTSSTNVILANNSTAVFAGQNNITFNGTLTKAAGANDQTFSNNLENGKVLTFGGNFVDAETGVAVRTINMRGYGSTVFNGIVQNNTAGTAGNQLRLDIRIADGASVTLGGDNKGAALGFTGDIILGQGTLIAAHTGALGVAANNLILDGGTLTSTVDLSGANKLVNAVNLQGDQVEINGSQNIEFGGTVDQNGNRFLRNNIDAGKFLTISGTLNLSSDNTAGRRLTIRGSGDTIISGVIANGGTGAENLDFSGTGSLTITNAATATGALTVNRNTVTLSGAGTGGSWNTGTVLLNPIGTLTLDNSAGNATSGRLSDTLAFTGNGGTLNIIGAPTGTNEVAGALTLNNVQTFITLTDNSSGAGNSLTFASVAFPNSGSSLNLLGVPALGTTNKVKFTAALPANAQINGVMPRTFISGGTFATYDATNGVQAFTNYNPTSTTDINAATATDTADVNAGLTTPNLTANKTINALRINGSGLSAGGAGRTLTLTSGALLSTGGDNSIDTAMLNLGTSGGMIQVDAGTTLTVNAALIGSTNWATTRAGTLQLNVPSFLTGTQNVLKGTLVLNGGLNTLFPNQLLNINDGATLDLNGNTQYFAQLNDPGVLPEAGGTITSLSGTGTIVTNMNPGSTTFATNINGNVNLGRVGGNTLTLESVNTYSGSTSMLGGTLQIQDDASILNTSSILLSNATLLLNNNSSLQRAVYDRIGDTTPITLRTGTITFNGKVSDPATETLGGVTAAEGANTISANTGGTGTAGAFTSADLTITSLTRTAGATINFTGSNLGAPGNNARIRFTTPLTVQGKGVLGAWAIANSTDYAAYNSVNGVGVVGSGGFAGYDTTFASGNITNLGNSVANFTTTLPGGNATTGLLRFQGAFNDDLAFTGGSDVLNLELGGVLRSNNNNSTSIGTTALRGVLTAGGTETSGTRELIIYSAATGTANFTGGATTATSSAVTVTSTVGLSPGMTVTNANLPTGTYIVSVVDGTTITVSQNATATATAQTLVAGAANVIVNSVISDNGLGNSVSLIKSGAGILNVSANNNYTGGTVVNQGTLNLIGSGVVIPAGGLTITNGTVTQLTNAGQIAAANVVTLNGSSVLNLNNALTGNNTLDSLVFNNNGGTGTPAVNIAANTTLTLTNAAPITVTSGNALTVPTISGGTLALGAGTQTIDVQGPTIAGQLYTKISPALNITSIITGTGSITKSNNGILQLSAQSLFNGLSVTGGGILISGNSTPTQGGAGIGSGPLGIGSVSMSSGTELLVDGSRSIGNDIAFAGTPTFDSTANTVWTLTLNGQLTGTGMASPTPTINIINPFLTVALLGKIPNIGTITSFNKTGLGTLVFNSTGYTGDFNATALGNPTQVQLLNDGDGTGSVQTIALGNVIFDSGIVPNIIVNRAGGTLPFPLAVNKILAPASISNLGLGLTLTNSNLYGLQASDAIAFTGTPTFSVSGTSASNITQGLYLTGDLTGSGFNKTGAGTVVINNATPANNTFTGNINITQGVLSVGGDGQLGNAANLVVLNPSTGTSAFRATGTFATSQVIQLANTANIRAIEVSNGNTLTLNSAFDLNAGAGTTAALNKQELGTLVINADNPTWSGQINITEGTILVNNPALTTPLGTGTIVASPAAVFGSALQLAGGVTLNNPLTLQGAANFLNGGINFQGTLDNVSGTNTYGGPIAMTFDSTIGARAGSTLNITGLITATGSHRLQFNAEGDINPSGGETGILFGIDKYGAGTLTISTAAFGGVMTTGGVKVEKGTLVLSGAGTTNSAGAVNIVYQGATMRLDNSGGNINNRLTARALTLQGGTFDFIANNSTETAGAFVSDQGANTINNGGSGTSALTFTGALTQNAGSSLNVTGTFGTATNFVKFSTAPALTPATTGILNRVTVNGNELASYSASLGVVAFTNYSAATNILSATATSTFKATTSTLNSLTGNQTLNALTINNTAAVGGLGGNPPSALTLTSGTILANGTGGAFLNVPIVTFGGEGIIHVQSGQTLTVNSGMSGTTGLSKDLAGELDINAQQFVSGTHYINGGTLKLTSTGVTNPLLFNQGMAVNVGGTVDLNGNNQFIAGLSSATAGGSSGIGGGTVTNSAVGQSTFTVNGNTNFGGVITGNIYLNKTGTGALNLQQPQTYSGPTLLTGGTTTLNDMGALPNTSQPIDIYFATLSLANGNFYDVGSRVSNTAPITLKGGQIAISGRQQYASSETLGAITIADGFNAFTTSAGGTNVNSLDVTAASLTRTGATATIRFNATGQLGSSARLVFTTAPTLTNNILGPWAIVDREYASYDTTYGIGALNGNGFAGYSGNGLLSGPSGTDNVRFTTAGTTVLTGNTTVGTLNFGQQATATVLNLGTNTLTVQGGGILFGQTTDNVDFSITNGSIAGPSGGGDLYLTHANFGGTNRTVTLNAPIVNNGGATRVIFTSGQVEGTGVGNTNLNAVNTNTGGTILNNGNIVLGATGALGTGGLTINQGILTQTAAGVIPSSNALTMGGSSLLTLANQANTLAGITFNNMGGAAPTVTPTGTLTLTSGITVTTMNAGGVATIGTGTLDLNAVNSFAVNVGATVINGVDVAPWQAGLSITSLIQNGGIAKSGAGLLQLSNSLSTFAGGITVTAGGLIIGASSFGPNLGDTLTSGPLGTGAVIMASGTSLVATGAFSVTNDFTFQGTGPLGATVGSTVFNGINSLTLNGNTTLPNTWNATVTAPQMTVTIGNVVGSVGSDVVNKSGLGTLTLGNYNGTINIAGGLIFLADGNGLGTPENVSLGSAINLTADTAITVNRSGGAPNARNKTVQEASLSNNGSILALNNQSGYGLEITGATTLTGASHFSVVNATASNVVPGLTLSGVVSDTGGFSLVKSGLGTLALTNSGNTFGGIGATIDVLNGVLAVNSNGALGNSNNTITLDIDGTVNVGFRATATFTATGRTFILNQPNNAFEVTAVNSATLNTLTLDTPFVLSATTNTLNKNDNGVLAINADNVTGPAWTGTVNINAGAIEALNNNALGSGTISVNTISGAALQLGGGVNVSNPFTIVVAGVNTGLNNGGVIESVSGSNTYSGVITQPAGTGVTLGADAGATLTITGGVVSPSANSITFAGAGDINFTTTGMNTGNSLIKLGSGTLTISVANPSTAAAQTMPLFAGTTVLAGGGTLGPSGTSTGAVTVDVGSTLTLDNTTAALGGTGSNVNNRLGTTRAITFRGGNFNLIGNETTTTTETFAIPTLARGLSVITVTAQTGAGANLVFTGDVVSGSANAQNSTSNGPTGVSMLFRGTNLGQAAANGVATIKDTGATRGFTFNGQTGANNTATKGILPWALIDSTAGGSGTSFATGDGTTFTITNLRPLAANEYGTANTVAANQNVLLNGGLTTNVPTGLTANSFTIDADASLTFGNGVLVSLSSGGILSRSGNTTSSISGGVLNQTSGFSPLNIWTVGNLTISSTINGGNGTASGAVGFVKAGAGTLTLSPALSTIPGLTAMGVNSMSGQLVINQGTLVLNGGKNTIQANNFLALNGGTLDLNGNSQYVNGLFTDGVVNGAGGTITSSTGTGNFITNSDTNRNWAGSITGSVNFTRSGQGTSTIYSPQTYTGSTLINGGAITLRDSATLSGTTSLDINYATLTLDNNAGTLDLTDRVKDTSPINLRGGTITFQGRALTASMETLGDVTLAQAGSQISSVVGGGTGVNSADLTLTSLTRAVGGGTVNFTAATGGQIGSSSRILIPTINGSSTATLGGGLTNDIIGGWAIIGASDFATYIPGLGVAPMGANGALQYSNTTSTVNTLNIAGATDNISINVAVTGNTISVSNDLTINSLRIGNIAAQTINIAAGKTLTLTSGGLLFFSTATQTIGAAVNQGNLTTSGPELFIYAQGTGPQVINSVIAGPGVTLIKSGGNALTLAGTNTYDGGTTVNQGTLTIATTGNIPLAATPANGLIINNAVVTLNAAGAIASGNIVTTNGGSTLNLFGNNAIAGLVMNNNGGTGNPSILTYDILANNGGPNSGTAGVLTIGSSGIVATSSNVGTTSNIFGRVDFGGSPNTINVDTINANGTNDVAPLQAALALQGVVGSAGGITKTGNGVLTLNAQEVFTGPLTVSTGGLRIGVTNGGSRFSALTLNSGTRLDLANASTTLGSLAGSGTVFASSGTPTLTVGFDGTSTIFSGSLSRFNDATPNGIALTKVGIGTLTMTSAQSSATGSSGTITVNGGGLTYAGAGKIFPSVPTATAPTSAVTVNVNVGGTLTLDNTTASGGNLNNRLGMDTSGAGQLNIEGGTLAIIGNDAANTVETVNNISFVNGGGVLTLTADAGSQLNLAIRTLAGENGTGTGLIRGINGTAAAAGNATLTITTPSLLGSQGTGLNGTSTMAVRRDILGDASVTGLGTGFLVKDTTVPAANLYRALGGATGFASGEYNLTPTTWATTQNAGINGTSQTLLRNAAANTMTMGGVSSLNSGLDATAFGSYGPGGSLLTQTMNINALLVLDGSTFDSNIGSFNGTAGTSWAIHTVGSAVLNMNSAFGINNTGGIIKADAGTLNFNAPTYYTGTTTVNDGTLKLGSGQANTLAVVPGATTPTVSALGVNGINALVDLNGQDQAVGTLSAINPLPGMGGTVTSSTAALLTSTGGGTFSGQITGSLAFTRAGNNTTLLTNPNTYSGATTVRGGVLQLRDSGSILNTASVTAKYGTILVDNFGLNPLGNLNPTRITATTPVTLQGGVLTLNGAGSTDSTLTLNSVTIADGQTTVNVLPFINEGSTATITIGNLQRNTANHSVVNFNGFTTNNSSGTSVTGGQGLSVNGDIFLNQINGATGPVNLAVANAVTTAGSAIVTVPSTAGLSVGLAVTGSGLPANEFITAINPDGIHFTITTGTGVTAQAATTITGKNLTNNLIGGWAVADGNTFATYVTGYGVSVMGQTTQNIAAPGFDSTDITTATALMNVNDGTTARTITGAHSANSWRFATNGTFSDTIATASSLTLGVGIIMNSNTTSTIQGTDSTSTITGSGSDLYVFTNQSTTNINTKITGAISLVKAGGATLALGSSTTATGSSNDYTGGTFVQAGTLNLNGAAGMTIIPGDLTINNAAVTMNATAPGQIATTSNIVINGGGSITLANYSTGPTQTLASISFDNQGGTGNPTFSFGTPTVATSTVVLSAANAITANNDSLATTPVFTTGAAALTRLQFSDASPVITTSGLSPNSLNIQVIIDSVGANGLTKMGAGSLTLSGANTFTTGFNLNEGTLIFGVATAGTVPTITSGPVGTGTLTIAGGTTIMSDGTLRTIGNATTINGDFTVGGVTAGNGVTLTGAMNLGAAGRTLTVTSPAVTDTISGAITSTATGTAFTKAGAGTLILSSAANNFGGASVAVTGGILKDGVANAIPTASGVAISAGAGFDLNNFDQTLDTISGTGFITNSANASKTLTVSSTVNNSTFDGVLTDNILGAASSRLVLTKAGAGTTLTLTNANTFSGATNVNGGVLSISNGSALGTTTGSTTVASGASLELQGGITVGAEALSITGTGSAASGALRNLSGSNTYGGVVTIGAGGASIQSDAGLLTLSNTVAATTQPVTFSGAGNTTVGGDITGTTASLTKIDGGTLSLSGNNSYAGGTNINGGVVQVASTGALGSSGSITFAGGTLQFTAANTTDYSNRISTGAGQAVKIDTNGQVVIFASDLTSSGGTLEKLGAGTLTVTGNNTYSGGTTVTAGVLAIENAAGSGTGSGSVTVAGGILTGNGTIGGDTIVTGSGVLNPGAVGAVGTINLAGNLTAATAGSPTDRLVFDVSSATGNIAGLTPATWATYSGPLLTGNNQLGTIIAGGNNDLVNMTGSGLAPTFNGNGTINTNMLTGYTWVMGDVLNLFDWVGIVSATSSNGFNPASPTDLSLPSLGSGLTWDTSRFLDTGAVAVIPEPGRALLLMMGLLSLCMRRRRSCSGVAL